MINMGRQKAVKSSTMVLFSTILVYSAQAQSPDELYRQIKANPNLSREQLLEQQHKVEQPRMQKYQSELEAARKRDAEEERKLQAMPDVPDPTDEQDAKWEREQAAKKGTGPKSEAAAGGSPARSSAVTGSGSSAPAPAPATISTSSDSPKVAFDPMPDEIHFDGEDPAPMPATTKPAPGKPASRAVAKPPKRQLKR